MIVPHQGTSSRCYLYLNTSYLDNLSLLILENKTEELVCNVKENSGILTLNSVYSYISVSSIKIF